MIRRLRSGELIRYGLTLAGQWSPARIPAVLNGAANFLETGRQLRYHGLVVPLRVPERTDLFDTAIPSMARGHTVYLEFGVYQGDTMRYWAQHLENPDARLIGFDSFDGLPEDWTRDAGVGHFSMSGKTPDISDPRVTFVGGWFDDTLPSFALPDNECLFLNVDSDLYSSAATVLTWAGDRIKVGDFLYFDEFHDRLHEGRAFYEYLDATGHAVRVVAATLSLSQILFQRIA